MKFEKVINFIKLHPEIFTVTGLFLVFYFIFFHNIGNYALMDVDETRYAAMARDMFYTKDFMTLYLNGDYFFEKPPLYFWGECLSFGIFGKVNEFTVRFPVAFYGMLTSFMVYITGHKAVSRKFGALSALILATSLEFLILAKFAILDIVLAMCVGFALCFGILTYFCGERGKKYLWWLFYLSSGLAVMAKGIPGFVIPFGTMFFTAIATKRVKELFRPIYWIPGSILFLLVVVPWHALMFNIHNPLFFNEYVVKHHLERFINSHEIGRKEPFYFFILTFLWGFFPWIVSLIAATCSQFKNIKIYVVEKLSREQRFLYLNVIAFLFTLIFFSSSSTKLVTYLLPVYIPACFIGAYIWNHYDDFKKSINISVYILGSILIIASILAIFTPLYLPEQLYKDILNAKWLCIILLAAAGILSINFARKNKPLGIFSVYVGLMLLLSAFGTKEFFNIDYKFGQNDLMEFAKFTRENNYELGAVDLGRKYSLLYYHGGTIDYRNADEIEDMFRNKNKMIIIKTKNLDSIVKNLPYETIKTGRRYSLIKAK